jgi:sugar transferase (PEP-CTERM system associated)
MIKVLNQYFPGRLFVLLVTENMLILVGIFAAIWYQVGDVRLGLVAYPVVFGKVLVITLVCQGCLYYADIYDLRNISSRIEVLLRVLQALGVAALLLAALFYLVPEMRLETGIVETSLVAIVFVILSWRILVEWLNRAYGAGERVLLVGSGDAAHSLAEELQRRNDLPIAVIGTVPEEDAPAALPGDPKVLGTLDGLADVIAESRPDRVVIALRERRRQLPIDVLLHYRMRGMLIEEASTLFQKLTGKIPVESINPSALIFTDGFLQSAWRRVLGRICGFLLAVLFLVLFGPLVLLVAVLIKLDSRGPALYRQQRVGLNGKNFDVLKFRSMRMDAEQASGPVWAAEEDPRVTRVGRYLRKLRLDELPQVINVLRGEMAFVGPRPERPHFVKQLKEQIPFYDLRHSLRPGITGWAQVSMHYGATVEDSRAKLEYDLFYIKNCSFSFDFLILFQTIKIVLFGRGAR